MAGLGGRIVFENVPVSTGSARTEARSTTAANRKTRQRWRVYFGGTNSAGSKILIDTVRGSVTGTPTATPPTIVSRSGADPEALQTTAEWKFTVEPGTPGVRIDRALKHPQGEYIGDWEEIKGGETFGIRMNTADAVTCQIVLDVEE